MFKVDRNLINANFECYRLASNDELTIQEIYLPSKVRHHRVECESTQFQVLADQLLKSSVSDDNQILLETGQLLGVSSNGFIQKESLEDAVGNEVSMHGRFVSTGAQIYYSGQLLDLPLSFASSDYPFTVKHSDEHYLLGYQVLPASLCQDLLIPEPKKNCSIFWVSLLKSGTGMELVGEYYSWGRPLIARIFDGFLLLGSSTGFSTKSSELIEIAESNETTPISPIVFDEQEFDEDEAEENQATSLILRSFSIQGQQIAESPIVSFSGIRFLEDGSLLVGIQCGVDVAVFKILDSSLATVHLYTLNAFAFIQSGKPRKKFTAFAENLAIICESSGSLYIYRMDYVEDNIARQYLVNLGDDEVFGLMIEDDNKLLVLLDEKLLIISF